MYFPTSVTHESIAATLRRLGFSEAKVDEGNRSGEVLRAGFATLPAPGGAVQVRYYSKGEGARPNAAQRAARDKALERMSVKLDRGYDVITNRGGASITVRAQTDRRAAAPRKVPRAAAKPNGAKARPRAEAPTKRYVVEMWDNDLGYYRTVDYMHKGTSKKDVMQSMANMYPDVPQGAFRVTLAKNSPKRNGPKAPVRAARTSTAASGHDEAARRARSGLHFTAIQFIDRFERKLLSSAPEDGEALKFSLRNGAQQLGLPADVHAQLLGAVEAMERRHEINVPYWKGRRVEAHPATDTWMQGDRLGVVTGVRDGDGVVSVKMDRSGKTKLFARDDVQPVS